MAHPTWLAYSFAVVMVAVSVYCVFRLVLARPMGRRNHYDINLAHVLMGGGMVGMLVPRWNIVEVGAWEVVFGVMALYFLARSVRYLGARRSAAVPDSHLHHISHYPIHMVMACAMLYMYWLGMPITAPIAQSMSMSSAVHAGDPSLTLFLVVVILASAVWQLDSIERYGHKVLAVRPAAGVTDVGVGVRGLGGGTSELRSEAAGVDAGPAEGTVAGGSSVLAVRGDERPWLAPRLEVGCHIAMCVTMAYMLVLMV
jgi:hypothetical protein